MTKLLLVFLINNSPMKVTIDYNSNESCSNAKENFVLAFTPNNRQSTSDETQDSDGLELFDNAEVKVVSSICTDLKTGSIF